MTLLGVTFALTRRQLTSTLRAGKGLEDQFTNSKYVATIYISTRNASFTEINKNMELISDRKSPYKVSNMKLVSPEEKPLVVCLSWLLSKRKTVLKYSSLYLEQGFDVLYVSITPWQLLWPKKGTQQVASDLLQFLTVNHSYTPLLLHGFSVGAYLWSEALVQIAQENKKYQPIVDRIQGQVWDSAADITEIPVGVPHAVFPRNQTMQKALHKYMMYHLKTFHKVATIHYIRGSQMFHTNLVKAPALFFLSKTDPIGAYSSNMRVKENWDSMGIPVYWKCWDRSPHVGHFRYHPKEYKEELHSFLDRLSLISNREKLQMKI